MSETLRELVVSLSLDSDNFSRNIKTINQQIKEAESAFKLAGAGVENFENTTQGAQAKVTLLKQKLTQQNRAVEQYSRALDAANKKLNDSYTRQGKLETKLKSARTAMDRAKSSVDSAKETYKGLADSLGETDSATIAAKQNLEQAEKEYAAASSEVKKLEGQVKANTKTLQNNADAVSKAQTNLNNAKAAVKAISAELKTAASAWTAFGKAATSAGSTLQKAGENLSGVGKTLTKMLTTPIVALGTTAVKASIDFEDSFASVRKTVDATEEEFDSLAAASKKMSTEVATGTDEINEVMATGGQLGIATEHLAEFTRIMIDLGNSCEDLSANEAATTLAKFANIMGTDQNLFSNIGSTIVELGNNFATTEAEIMEMAMRMSGAGKQVGLTEAQVLGFATALSSVGINAEAGGSAFSKVLIKMETAAATGGQALKDFSKVTGLTTKEFKAMWESNPAAVFQLFIENLAKMDDEGISAIATLNEIGFSEVRLRDTMLRSVNATDLFSGALVTADKAWKENTALTEEANKRYATTKSRLTNLKNTAVLFGQRIGDDLNPTINNLIDGASGLLEKFMALDASQRMQIIQFAAIAAAAGPVSSVLGKVTSTVGKGVSAVGNFATAVGKAGGGLTGLGTVLGNSPTAMFALTAAVVLGTAAFIDYASGAKAAREALKDMQTTADNWKNTAADTFYGSSEGLSFFDMSTDDFKNSGTNMAQSGADWLAGMIEVWTDGKKETTAAVNEWINSFKSGTEEMRTALSELQISAEESGYTGLSAQMEADLKSLDGMDAEISKLLKKRRNKTLTDDDKIRLQELVDAREAIQIKYNLVPDTANTAGFSDIRNKVEAEINRAAARGEEDADVSVYENAIVATAQGMAEINKQIDDNYDKEFALIQMIDDSTQREAALADLNNRYSTERTAAAREYADTLRGFVMPVWESKGIQKSIDDVDQLAALLSEYSALDANGRSGMLSELNALTASMDEGALTEYISLLVQIQSLVASGMSESEVQALFPEIDFSAALDQIAGIQSMLNNNKWDTNLASLSSMFGEALPEEVLKIATDLDMTGAQARWNEFAQNPGAITTDLIIRSQISITGYDLQAYNHFVKENPIEVEGVVRLAQTDYAANPSGVVNGQNVKFYGLDGIEIPATAVSTELLDASTLCVLDADGTLHVLVTPEITGSQEAVDAAAALVDEVDQLGLTALGPAAGIAPTTTMDMIASAMQRLNSYKDSQDLSSWEKFWATLRGESTDKGTLDRSMQSDFSPERISELTTYVTELFEALQNGTGISDEDEANLTSIIQFLNELDTAEIGGNVLSGVAEGMTAYGWDTDAETVASDLESALNGALDIHSPSKRMIPVGENTAAGVGEGMAGYDFGADAAAMADKLFAAATAALSGARLRPVGVQAMAGLTAGINAGRAGVVSAMRSAAQAAVSAAKSTLKIHSPSRVFRDEVGAMTMKGFGEGVISESKKQAATIRNASRYLTGEAKNGSVAPISTNNSKTYNNNSTSFSFAGASFNIRSEQDIRDLAVEIATLTKRNQRGKGLRMA